MVRKAEDVVCVTTKEQGPVIRYKHDCDNSGMSVAGFCPGCEQDLLVEENIFVDGNNKCPNCGAHIGRGWRYSLMNAF